MQWLSLSLSVSLTAAFHPLLTLMCLHIKTDECVKTHSQTSSRGKKRHSGSSLTHLTPDLGHYRASGKTGLASEELQSRHFFFLLCQYALTLTHTLSQSMNEYEWTSDCLSTYSYVNSRFGVSGVGWCRFVVIHLTQIQFTACSGLFTVTGLQGGWQKASENAIDSLTKWVKIMTKPKYADIWESLQV